MSKGLFDLTGQVAVVTGASRGTGAVLCAGAGERRRGSDPDQPRARTICCRLWRRSRRWGGALFRWSWMCGTSRVSPRWPRLRRRAIGRIDILVNNAGCNVRKPALEVTWEDWNLILDTNLRGSFFVAQAIARRMVPHGYGRIINIGSVTSVFGYAGLAPYGASRGGMRQLTMSLADDWGRHGITVNCLAPGWFETAQNRVLYENKEWVEYLVERIPLKRPGAPNDLDGAVVFLASEASRYITGQTLLVDGGISTGSTRATVAKARSLEPVEMGLG